MTVTPNEMTFSGQYNTDPKATNLSTDRQDSLLESVGNSVIGQVNIEKLNQKVEQGIKNVSAEAMANSAQNSIQ